MEIRCKYCGSAYLRSETSGHCNAHGEPDYQVTTVMYCCGECGRTVYTETWDTRNEEPTVEVAP